MRFITTWLAAGLVLLAAGAAQAGAIHNESGDASNVFGSQQIVGAGVSQIDGAISSGDDADLYQLTFGAAGTLTVEVTDGMDTEIYLFDSAGHGILGDDDSGSSFLSRISVAITPGTYLLAIGDYRLVAYDGDGDAWDTLFATSSPPANFDTLDHLTNISSIGTYSYTITLSMDTVAPASAVPLPSAAWMGLALLGGLGLAAHRRRRRTAALE